MADWRTGTEPHGDDAARLEITWRCEFLAAAEAVERHAGEVDRTALAAVEFFDRLAVVVEGLGTFSYHDCNDQLVRFATFAAFTASSAAGTPATRFMPPQRSWGGGPKGRRGQYCRP